MADLFSVTAPLAIRFADGTRQIMVERVPFADGIAYLPPFWTRSTLERALRIVPGPIKGEGPWKSGDAVITVLGCHGTDAELAQDYACWQSEVAQIQTRAEPDEIHRQMLACAQRRSGTG